MERTEIERRVVEQALRIGVRRQQDLKPTIQANPVDLISRHPAAHAIRGLAEQRGFTRLLQPTCAREPGETGSDNDRVNRCAHAGNAQFLSAASFDGKRSDAVN